MTAQPPESSEPLPGTVFSARQVRVLKIAVIVMGLLLVGGFAFVLSAIVYQASHLGGSAPATGAATADGETAFTVPDGMSVSHMALGDNRLAVHLEGPGGGEIRIIDLGTGAVVGRVRLKPE